MQEQKKTKEYGNNHHQPEPGSADATFATPAKKTLDSKQQRLASALRDNLKRRKASNLKHNG